MNGRSPLRWGRIKFHFDDEASPRIDMDVDDFITRTNISVEAVATHRLRHVLTNALGGEKSKGEAEIHRMRLFDGDQILLCSDGLHDMVDDETITELLKTHREATPACQSLVEAALTNGGKDNVTVVVASYAIPQST